MTIKTPKRIRKDFEIKAGFTQNDVKGVMIGVGAGLATSLPMISSFRLLWILLTLLVSIWLMLPSKEARKLKHWQLMLLLLTNPVRSYIAERDSRKGDKENED